MAIFRGKIGEEVGLFWPSTNSFLLLGVHTSVSNLVKIDKEMRPWEWWDTDTHTHTDWQTQTDFIICPMLYAIAMGQIIIVVMPFCICKYSQQHFFHGAVVLCRLGSVNKVWRCANDDWHSSKLVLAFLFCISSTNHTYNVTYLRP